MRFLNFHTMVFAALAMAGVSCNSTKNQAGLGDGSNPYDLADNGGYTSGGFYGSDTPSTYNANTYAQSRYPSEGESLGAYDASAGVVGTEQAHVIPFTESHGAGPAPVKVAAAAPKKPVAKPSPAVPARKPVVASAPKKPAPTKKVVATTKPQPAAKKPPVVAAAKKPATQNTTKTQPVAGAKKGAAVKTVYQPPKKSGSSKPVVVRRLHTVKPGDNLTKLSSRYGVNVATLKNRNKLTSDRIIVGQRLQID